MDRDKLVNFVNSHLKSAEIKDHSLNGLQVEGKKEIKKILFGVSVSLELIKRAVSEKADMIIVHHGLYWGKDQPLTGRYKERAKLLLENDINFCAWHLPLDLHPEIGNNIRIIKLFNPKKTKPFGLYEGVKIGFKAELKKALPLSAIAARLAAAFGSRPVILGFGPQKVKTFGVVSGGGQSLLQQAADEKLDLYITGEISEHNFETARENGINFMAAGHYNTEKAGIWALQELLEKKFRLKTAFLDTRNPI